MAAPVVASRTPFALHGQAGESYWWCACGESQRQPLRDGSRQRSAFTPAGYRAAAAGTAWFCGCKHSQRAPLRDGSHRML
jgi:CDGSH iron-sulfur domain-containing protein 3